MEPFPIQSLAVPIGLSGHDIIGQARTGTGKTLAFGIPLLQRIEHGKKKPLALVIVPTRELAIQVTADLVVAGGKLGSRVLAVYGGRAYEPQIQALKEGVEAVVGTPGRLLDLVKQKYLDLSQVSVLVLDEADRMLDLGFLPDIERLVDRVPAKRQTMLFSATMPGEIVALSRKYLTRPTNVRAESHEESETTPQVVQHVFQAHQMDKPELLARVLQARGRGLTMVFCQTKRACDRVAEDLVKRGFAAAAVHGDLGQGQRERALRAFRAGKIDVLVATDVAARGLDVDDVTHVINYECPDAADTYVHRIGRTGRAGKEGISVTLVDWKDLQRWKLVNAALGMDFAEPAETYSTSEHLYEALDIPTGITGTLPRAQRDRAGLEAEEVEDIGETGRNRSQQRSEPPARKPRTRSRTRQRTRGGQPLEDETGTTVTEAAEAPEPAVPAEDVPEKAERKRPARRRTPRAADAAVETDSAVETESAVETDAVVETENAVETKTAVAVVTATETPVVPPARREAPTSVTPAGIPVVEFMAPPVDPAAAELPTHPAEQAQSQPRRRRRTRSGGARR
ncbi:DEAD/DEAH box helicase [Actinomadura sp. DC4]|uniref:DEAD/DEAH box helicase n=1 Tax=Actinomadura sp. DC4 TaxID=3055069 RepID=UPI0025AFD4F7|nr:DEAD/DEAH box helicase [Actinomadura sp. DC4]MDN3352721.1 DEAD/DEAH box helicase [Actinomadura sp. DC4]